MSSHRVRKRQAAYSKMSKKPGLVSTLGRSMFVRRIIRNRTNCGNGCNPEILGVLVAVLVNNSPIEIPLTFTEPITVNWDDENNPGKVTYQPGDRVFHNYLKANGGDADPRERTITVTYKNNVEFDYSEDQGSYLQTHAAEIEADAKYTFAPKVGDNLTGKDGTQYYVSKIGADATELQLSTSSFPIKKVVEAAFEFNADSDRKQGDGVTVGLSSGDKIFEIGGDAIEFVAGVDADLWVYTTRNDKKDGILEDEGTNIVAGKKFFLSTNDPYDVGNVVGIADKLNGPAVTKDNEVAQGSGFFARATVAAGFDFEVYKKTQILNGSAEEVAIAATANVNAEGNAAGVVEEFRHTAQKTEGQGNNTAAGVNDGDVVVGDLIKTDNGIRYFAATTAAQGAKFTIYTDEKIARADTAGLVGPAAGFGIERATKVTELTAAELETAEDRIHDTKWANIINDATAAKANLTFNRAGNGANDNDFQFTRDLKKDDILVGNDGQIYYAAADADAGANVTLKIDAIVTTGGAAPAGVGTAVDAALVGQQGARAATLALFQEGAIEKTNGAGGAANGTGDHIIYKRSKVNTIRKSIKEIKKFGKEKATKIRSFEGASNLKKLGGPNPPSFNPKLKNAFKGAANLDTVDNIGSWNTKNVTNMEGMFEDAAKFNLVVNFDTKNVTKMNNMFKGAKVFDKEVDFNTEKVTNMKSMFEGAVDFDKPINFNTKEVTDVTSMFNGATKFNQDLDHLDFRKVGNGNSADIDTGTEAATTAGKKPAPEVGQRKAILSGNVVALEKGDKLFVEMKNGDFALGYVDNVFKGNFNDTTDSVYAGFEPGDNNHVAVKASAENADKKSRATLTVGGVTATILGIEVRHTTGQTQNALDDNHLYVYLNKNLGNLGMTLKFMQTLALVQEVVIAPAAPVVAADVNDVTGTDGITEEQILARDGFAIDGGNFVKPAGFTVYKFARPAAAADQNAFDDILGGDRAAGERSIVFK